MKSRLGGFLVLAASTVAGFKVGSVLPQSQYAKSSYPESLKSHPYALKLLQEGWELDPHQLGDVPSFHRKNMALSGILAGEDKFKAPPLSFTKGTDHQTLFWLGDALAHPDTDNGEKSKGKESTCKVHNGIAMTLLDHNLAQTALQGRRALTKSLQAKFSKDIPSGVIALTSRQIEQRTRSASAEGSIYQVTGDKLGDKLADGSVVMVRPKWAPNWLP